MARFNNIKSLIFFVYVVLLFGGSQGSRWTRFREKLQREAQRIANQTERFVNKIEPTLKKAEDDAKAAHCFWNMTGNKPLDISAYKVAAGKYHRDWYIEDKETQKRDLADLYIHERFNGIKRNLAYDIAIIRVAEEFKLTWAINTICMDYPKAFEDIHLRPGNNGLIAGWGVTENNTQSDVLMSVQLPYVDYLECGDLVDVQFQKFLTDDKICAGFVGQNTAVCPGDSGGGYVFPHNTERGIRYYLRGIVSAGHVPAELWRHCATDDLSAFTLVSKHRTFVEQHVFNKGGVAP